MKLIRCHIDNFGNLSDFDYDFSDGLNTIIRDNGWGKTTFAAFLKAMLYGISDSNDRKKYISSEKKYGGILELVFQGKKYRINRTFDLESGKDTSNVSCLDESSSNDSLTSDKIGDTLFSLDEFAFHKIIFKKNNVSITGSIEAIKEKLDLMKERVEDFSEFDNAIQNIKEKISEYENDDKTGILDRLVVDYNDKKIALMNMKSEIKKIDSVRESIRVLESKIAAIDKEISQSKKENQNLAPNEEYDALIAEFQAVTTKYNELSKVFDSLIEKYNGSVIDYPTLNEIEKLYEKLENTKQMSTEHEVIEQNLLRELENLDKILKEDPNYIDKLVDILFSQNEIKELVSRIKSAKKKAAKKDLSLEDKNNAENNGNELDGPSQKLLENSELKKEVDELKNQYANNGIKKADLIQKTKIYESEFETLVARKKELLKYSADAVNPVIEALGAIRDKYNSVSSGRNTINYIDNDENSQADNNTIKDNEDSEEQVSEDKCNFKTCKYIIDLLDNADKKSNNLSISRQKLERENEELEELKATLGKFGEVTSDNPKPMKEPKEPNTNAGYVSGALLLIASVAGAIFVTPFIAAGSILGIIIIAVSYSNSKKYVNDGKLYEKYEDEYLKEKYRNENIKDIKGQYERTLTSVNILKKLIVTLENEIKKDEQFIRNWSDKFNSGLEVTKEDVVTIMNNLENEMANSLLNNGEDLQDFTESYAGSDTPLPKRNKSPFEDDGEGVNNENVANETSESNELNPSNKQEIPKELQELEAQKKEICKDFTEVHEMSVDEAIEFFKSRLDEAKKVDEKLRMIRRNVDSIRDEIDNVALLITQEANEIEKIEQRLAISDKSTENNSSQNNVSENNLPEKSLPENNLPENSSYQMNDGNSNLINVNLTNDNPNDETLADGNLPAVRERSALSKTGNKDGANDEITDHEVAKNIRILKERFEDINQTIEKISLNMTEDNYKEVYAKIKQTVNVYEKYSEILNKKEEKEEQYKEEINSIKQNLDELLAPYSNCYTEMSLKDKISHMKEDINLSRKYSDEIKDVEEKRYSVQDKLNNLNQTMANNTSNESNLDDKKKEKQELINSLEKQKENANRLNDLLERYYQNKCDLEKTEHLQDKISKELDIYKKTLDCLLKTKQNSTSNNKSTSNGIFVDSLNKYFNHFVEDSNIKLKVDDKLNVLIDNSKLVQEAFLYGSGYNDFCDFCMRLALLDSIYTDEKPFIILDDPFVNLDSSNLEKALTLLDMVSQKMQVVYYTSHKSRAIKDITTLFTKIERSISQDDGKNKSINKESTDKDRSYINLV